MPTELPVAGAQVGLVVAMLAGQGRGVAKLVKLNPDGTLGTSTSLPQGEPFACDTLAGGGAKLTQVPIPPGTYALLVQMSDVSFPHFTQITLVGHTTGVALLDMRQPPLNALFVVPAISGQDQFMDVTVAADSTQTLNCYPLPTSIPEFQQFFPSKQTLANLASATYNGAAAYTGPPLTVPRFTKRLLAGFNVTAITGGPTGVTLLIEGQGPDGNWYTAGALVVNVIGPYTILSSPEGSQSDVMLPLTVCRLRITIQGGAAPSVTTTAWLTAHAA